MIQDRIARELKRILRHQRVHGSDYDSLYFGIQDVIDEIDGFGKESVFK